MVPRADDAAELFNAIAFGMAVLMAPQALQHPRPDLISFYSKPKGSSVDEAVLLEASRHVVGHCLEEEAVEGLSSGGFPHPDDL